MYKKISFFLTLFVFIPILALSQQKIGFVITDEVFRQLPEAQAASKQLEGIQKESVDTLLSIERDLQAKYGDFQQKESMMPEESKKKAQKEIVDLQNKYQELKQKKSDDLQKRREALLQPIIEKIQKTIEQVAKDEGLSFVFDKTQSLPVMLYGDAEFNITNKVLDVMIRGGAKTPKKKNK